MPCLTRVFKSNMEEKEDVDGTSRAVNSEEFKVAVCDAEQNEGDSSRVDEPSPLFSKSGLPLNQLRTDLLNFLCSNEMAHFKSQQKGDPELSQESKRAIAEDLLDRSPASFLQRFGQFLQERHLTYFLGEASLLQTEAYEIKFHLKELERFYCKATHDVSTFLGFSLLWFSILPHASYLKVGFDYRWM